MFGPWLHGAATRGNTEQGVSGGESAPLASMAPVDLLSMLNAPFATIKSLQVPPLTNALVGVSGLTDIQHFGDQLGIERVQRLGAVELNDLNPAFSAGNDGLVV